jgi:hypothetical protein
MRLNQLYESVSEARRGDGSSNLRRRGFLRAAALAAGAGALGYAGARRGVQAELQGARFHGDDLLSREQGHQTWYRYKFIGQAVMDNQLVFWLGLAPTGLTDVGEVLDTATRIQSGDEVSWFEQWLETAARVRGYGEAALARGHRKSAASHFYRAGAYQRAGLMRYAQRSDPRLVTATKSSLQLHDAALRLRGYDSQQVEIPYAGSVLHGRVHYAANVGRAPTLILHQGLHAWPEDTMWVVDGALERGYHVLSFHGPGQGASLRLHGHPFRPDWEVPVAAVLDFAQRDPRLDASRFLLMGLSFGGYLAPRAASREPRVHTLIADPGVVSWADSMLRHFESMPGLMRLHAAGPQAFDRAIDAVASVIPDARWYFDDVSWKHGVSTPHALVDELRKYHNPDVARIRCQTLILEGSGEDATPGESQRLYDALTCKKQLLRFDASTASQMHCQGGNQQLARAWLFDWLDEQVHA